MTAAIAPGTSGQPPSAEYALAPGVRRRNTRFGAIAYVPSRDHFFALDKRYADLVADLEKGVPVQLGDAADLQVLAGLGICRDGSGGPQRAFYGRSHLGTFDTPPEIDLPLVVNCFTTAFCPLRCAYCHADDLMIAYRPGENSDWIHDVARTASMIPAMVGVVTGGEPVSRPDQAALLIDALAQDKAVVLDTSGMGDLSRLIPTLRRHHVHVRVSIDSPTAAIHDAVRPINRRYLPLGTSPHAAAVKAVELALNAQLSCSVQTVVTNHNAELEHLVFMRDWLVRLGVTTWVLHILVPVGKASRPAGRRLANASTVPVLQELIARSALESAPIDIRVTNTGQAPNSVVLVSASGEFCVENADGTGKIIVPMTPDVTRDDTVRLFRQHVNARGHADRYLNGLLAAFAEPLGGELSLPDSGG